MLWLIWAVGCSGKGAECGPEQCREVCDAAGAEAPAPDAAEPAPPAAAAVTPAEQAVLDAVLVQIRAGIRPWASEDAIGVCRGRSQCDKFLGAHAGKLTRGNFFVRADLIVPPAGTWKVQFTTECVSDGGEVRAFEREYEVTYAGPDRPSRIQPLRAFDVPSEDGHQKCTWKLTAPDPAGDRVFEGSWEMTGK